MTGLINRSEAHKLEGRAWFRLTKVLWRLFLILIFLTCNGVFLSYARERFTTNESYEALGQAVKAKYPNEYGDLSDFDLGRRVDTRNDNAWQEFNVKQATKSNMTVVEAAAYFLLMNSGLTLAAFLVSSTFLYVVVGSGKSPENATR